jgi:hypothetical protein
VDDEAVIHRWSLADAGHRGYADDLLDPVQAVLDTVPSGYDETGDADRARSLALRTFEGALEAAAADGVFSGVEKRPVLGVFIEGQPEEDRLASVRRLNPADAADRFEAELEEAEDTSDLSE